MATQPTLKRVLEKAIQKEIEARLLYLDLSQKVNNQAVKDACQKLAQEEEKHRDLLEQYRRGELTEGSLNNRKVIDYKIAEHLDQPQLSPDMPLKDIFLLAASREKASHEFYLGLAQIHPAGDVKRLLEELAAQELKHKQIVEFLYTEVAFPQTDGG